jgi:hypothetical protein
MSSGYRRVTRLVCSALLLPWILACVSGAAHPAYGAAASTPPDQPKPRIPQEIIADKRLDQKMKVFCKSKGMRDLFADLSAKTGVKMTITREVSGERPTIFFHNRTVRDVMMEVSGLYGYHWLVSGKQGEYSYELCEDARHAQERDQAARGADAKQRETLLNATEKYLDDYSDSVKTGAKPHDKVGDLFSAFGMDFFRSVLANGGYSSKLGSLPPEWQTAICNYINQQSQISDEMRQQAEQQGVKLAVPASVTPADMATSDVVVEMVQSDATGLPSFKFSVQGNRHGQSLTYPPTRFFGNGGAEGANGAQPQTSAKEDSSSDDKLPASDTKITIEKLRWLPAAKGLLLGDVLEGIAVQTGKDVIADYHFQNTSLGAIKAQTLKQVVDLVHSKWKYSLQGNGDIIRFRYDLWYKEPPSAEPPQQLIEGCWAKIEGSGALALGDLLSLGDLSDDQLNWRGFNLIPGASAACKHPAMLRLWKSLTVDQEKQARADGVSVSNLSVQQLPKLDNWVREANVQASADEVQSSNLRIGSQSQVTVSSGTMPGQGTGSPSGGQMTVVQFGKSPDGKEAKPVVMMNGERVDLATMGDSVKSYVNESLSLILPGGRSYPSLIKIENPLSEQDRKDCAAQRKADREADVIEVF